MGGSGWAAKLSTDVCDWSD